MRMTAVLAPHLAWPELERRARAELSLFLDPIGVPSAERCARLWTWFSLGQHTTWSFFRSGDVGAVVRTRWDREDAAARIGLGRNLPVPVALLEPHLDVADARVPLTVVEAVLARFRPHVGAAPAATIGVDGVEYGFELVDGDHRCIVSWSGHSAAPVLSDAIALTVGPLDSLFQRR